MIRLWNLVEHAYKKLITHYAPDTSLKSCHRSMWQFSFSSTYKPHSASASTPGADVGVRGHSANYSYTALRMRTSGNQFRNILNRDANQNLYEAIELSVHILFATGFGLWKTSRVNAEHFFGSQLSDLGSYPQVPHCTNLTAFTCTFQASAS